jgi:hypothetical protein
MSDYIRTIDEMDQQARKLRGDAQLKKIVDIIELARANDDADAIAEYAKVLVESAWQAGRIHFELRGFGELKNLYTHNPKFADLRPEVLWYYKWIVEHLPEYVDVPQEQIESTLSAMEDFYRSENEGLRPVYALRWRIAAAMGQFSRASEFAQQWEQAPSQESDDCLACQTHMQVQIHLDMGDIRKAIQTAKPIVLGEQHCTEVPAVTFSRLLMPLVLVGRDDLAFTLGGQVSHQVRKVPNLVGYLADHVIFLSLVGQLRMALRRAVIMLARNQDTLNDQDKFLIARAAWIFLSIYQATGHHQISLPRTSFPAGPIPVADALEHYRSKAASLAAAFDARNQSDRFANLIAEAESLAKIVPESSG